jgi:hypothetical protein
MEDAGCLARPTEDLMVWGTNWVTTPLKTEGCPGSIRTYVRILENDSRWGHG